MSALLFVEAEFAPRHCEERTDVAIHVRDSRRVNAVLFVEAEFFE